MSSNYSVHLPEAFPWTLTQQPYIIKDFVSELLEHGSSFAVTVDGNGGEWRLWLSENSKEHLVNEWDVVEEKDLLPGARVGKDYDIVKRSEAGQ